VAVIESDQALTTSPAIAWTIAESLNAESLIARPVADDIWADMLADMSPEDAPVTAISVW
jgi:hypothetical protein